MTRVLVRDDFYYYRRLTNHRTVIVPSQPDATTVDEEQIARNVQALKNRLRGKTVPGSGGARKGRRGAGGAGSGLDSMPGSEYATLRYLLPTVPYH